MLSNISKIDGYILLRGGLLYDPFLNINENKDILIKDNKIISVKKSITLKDEYHVIDCENKIVTNGFIDIHSHFREPGFEYKETIETGSVSAFHGGYTRVCVMPNTDPVIDSPELCKSIIEKSKELPVYVYPIGAITKGQKGMELSEVGGMVNSGAVAISDDGLPVKNGQMLKVALEYAKKFNIPVINHAEDLMLVNDGLMHEGSKSLKLGLPGNPDISESTMVYRDLSIAEYVNGRLHVPHVSSAKSIDIIKQFKAKNINITAEVTPHHLCFNDEIISDYNTNSKVAPPIRSSVDQKALVKGVLDGVINCIATDHAPHSIDDKEKDFENAMCGMIGLESAFGLVNKTLKNAKMDIKSVINLFTINPAQIVNVFPNYIQEGHEAEINIIDSNIEWDFNKKHIYSLSKNTPVLGKTLVGKVLFTINKGFISNYKVD
tara:strand:+ start:82 stop:1386 length:1305 start_codon:yes stop_codon:yes gene_type:complete